MSKKIIISIGLFFSIWVSTLENCVLINVELIINLLFTLLGLSLTSYTFIYGPITEILKKMTSNNKNVRSNLQKMLKSFEEDMRAIFYLGIFIILLDILKATDIPLFNNLYKLDMGLIKIYSLKEVGINLLISLSTFFAFYAFYDLMQATFKILRNSFEMSDN